jgi:hypothetical protein
MIARASTRTNTSPPAAASATLRPAGRIFLSLSRILTLSNSAATARVLSVEPPSATRISLMRG